MLFYVKTIVSLEFFVSDCLWKPFLDCKLAQVPLNLMLLTILVTVRPWFFTWFYPKDRAIKFQKRAKFVVIGNSFCDLSTEVDIWSEKYFKFVL